MKVIVSASLSKPYDRRYVVVEEVTGEILDDAQGYGYKTAQNAHRAFGYKAMPRKKRAQHNAAKRRVERWCASQKAFMDQVQQEMFYAMKDREQVGKNDVEELLAEAGLELPFPVEDLMRWW